jgi:hypothetical protein
MVVVQLIPYFFCKTVETPSRVQNRLKVVSGGNARQARWGAVRAIYIERARQRGKEDKLSPLVHTHLPLPCR